MTTIHDAPTAKPARRRLAKAELRMQIAITVQRWAGYKIADAPDDDPLAAIARHYDLDQADISRILTDLAAEAERAAMRNGYEDVTREL